MSHAIGIDIGVTNVKAVGVTASREVLFRHTMETHAESPDWPARVKSHLADLELKHGRADRVGIAAPGVARADGASIRWMRGRLAEVQCLNWSQYLGRPVPVLNDAQAALLGEVWQGAARAASNVILLTLGTGVGGAAMVDGRLLRGHLGRAGHLGHICLDIDAPPDIANTPGSLEAMIGNYSISERSAGCFRTTHALIDAYRNGDQAAARIWERSLDALACGIASLINVLDPQIVIIGGGIAVAADALFAPLKDKVSRIEWSLEGEHVQIVPAALGEYAGAIGAAWNAMQNSEK
ncbi:MAG TPA: ROK family protein [Tepidisphaeraceae bacterium]